jgi:hypothetical protein
MDALTSRAYLIRLERYHILRTASAARVECIKSVPVKLPACCTEFGACKTTLAKMLPDAIEKARVGHDTNMPADFIACQQGTTGPQVMGLIDAVLGKNSFNTSGLHYFVLDEVDNLTKAAQQSLKSALNTKLGVFVLTTNHRSDLDKGMLDRCILVEMNAPTAVQLGGLADKIAAAANVF